MSGTFFLKYDSTLGRDTRETDGGFGILQLTDPAPSYSTTWNYQKNIDSALQELYSSHVIGPQGAQTRVSVVWNQYSTLGYNWSVTPAHIRREMYRRYNAGPSGTLFRIVYDDYGAPWVEEGRHPYVESLYRLEQRLLRQNGLPFDQNYMDKALEPDWWGTTQD